MANKNKKVHTKKRKNATRDIQDQEEQQQSLVHPTLRTNSNSIVDLSLSLNSNNTNNVVIPQSNNASSPSSAHHSEPQQQALPNPTQPKPKPKPKPKSKGKKKGKGGKTETIPCPYPWAKDTRAKVHTLKYLLDNGMHIIFGEAQCKKCEKKSTIEYNVAQKFGEITSFIEQKQEQWHERAPKEWVEPNLPTCPHCGQEDSCKPVMSDKKRWVNWLFLLLGQLLGCCTLAQLKYFCKHNRIHRTGAKNRVLLYTYLALCKQLNPDGHYNYQSTTS